MGRVVFPPCCLTCDQRMVEVMKMVMKTTHLEPGTLECEVKWALGSITTNKTSGSDGIPVSCFKSSKMMLSKCCTQYASKFGKLSSALRTGKGEFSFQSQRKAMPKKCSSPLHFSHSVMSNSLQPHEPQHTRHPCPSPTPGVYPNSCPLSRWCHPTISSSLAQKIFRR